jgi:hypothetical protein
LKRRGADADFALEKPDGMMLLGIRTLRREDAIKMDLKGIGWKSVGWINLAEFYDKWRNAANTEMSLRVT